MLESPLDKIDPYQIFRSSLMRQRRADVSARRCLVRRPLAPSPDNAAQRGLRCAASCVPPSLLHKTTVPRISLCAVVLLIDSSHFHETAPRRQVCTALPRSLSPRSFMRQCRAIMSARHCLMHRYLAPSRDSAVQTSLRGGGSTHG